MGFLDLLSDYRVVIAAIVAMAGCCYFLYKFWNKSKLEAEQLKRRNMELERQLAHGYLVEEDELNSNGRKDADEDEEEADEDE